LLVALTLAFAPAPAAAAGLLDFLFGGFRALAPQPPARVSPPSETPRHQESLRNGGSGPSSGYCVRLCDGRYFPVHSQHNLSATDQCSAECPATATKVFSGSGIDNAVASDGSRYSNLPNAFVYRKHIIPSCSCNGRTNYGLTHMPVTTDPTLRPGDIVATNSGLSIYNSRGPNQQPSFTPIDSASVSKGLRAQFADVKVTPRADAGAASDMTGQAAAGAGTSPRGGGRGEVTASER
jgi:hypothetical protein